MTTNTCVSHPCAQRIQALQAQLTAHDAHALVVPSADPHLSEYLPAHWQGREWLCGFTGSMGTLVVLRNEAALFADSRYWVQAEAQLAGTGVALVKITAGSSVAHIDWLMARLNAGQTVLMDGRVVSLADAERWRAACDRMQVVWRTDLDVLALLWHERPPLPTDRVYEHAPPHACVDRAQKLLDVRNQLQSRQADHHWISSLDDIAWLLNLRGSDVPYNPVFVAHLLITPKQATLFVDPQKLSAELTASLRSDGVEVAPYDEIREALSALPADARLCVDPARTTLALRERVPADVTVVHALNPSTEMKSQKTNQELQHWRQTMASDGAALCEFYAAFEALLADGPSATPITELTVDAMLYQARSAQPGFKGLSFATIAAFNANGAMPHYRATEESHAVIQGHGLLLIDSGAQYLGGTTDITRVWAIGQVTPDQQRDYTLVLKGMMALSRTTFPVGTLSPMLDAIARAPLWSEGLDFGHGTGHGVGYFLNVHEGPQSISRAVPQASMAMRAGMVTSIEPGVYRPGRWGIRIENLVANVPAPHLTEQGFGEFLAFETLTLCPIDTRCIARDLLRADEVLWLNNYHAMVRERLQPLVSGAALNWLLKRTEALA